MQKKNEAYALLMKKAENASEEQNKSYYAEAMELLPEEPGGLFGLLGGSSERWSSERN